MIRRKTYTHILHFRCFFTWPFVPVHSYASLKNSSMSAVLPSRVDPDSAIDWTSMSIGMPSSSTASELVGAVEVHDFLADN